jgi:hypothetical protein
VLVVVVVGCRSEVGGRVDAMVFFFGTSIYPR